MQPVPISSLIRKLGILSAVTAIVVISLTQIQLAPAQAQDQAEPDVMISPTDLRGNERIWGLILYATDEELAEDPAARPAGRKEFRKEAVDGVLGKVRKALPKYKGIKIIGAHDQKVLREYATWITPSTDFFLAIDSKGRAKAGDGINTYVQLWSRQIDPEKEDKVLLKFDAVLKRSQPVIIEGADWRKGRVIIVLSLEYSELFDPAKNSQNSAAE